LHSHAAQAVDRNLCMRRDVIAMRARSASGPSLQQVTDRPRCSWICGGNARRDLVPRRGRSRQV